jgi:hypothetical protein
MSVLVSTAPGPKLETESRHPSSVRGLARRHAVTLAVAGGTTARSLHWSFQSTEDLHESGLTS